MIVGPTFWSEANLHKGLQLIANEIQQQNVDNVLRGKVSQESMRLSNRLYKGSSLSAVVLVP